MLKPKKMQYDKSGPRVAEALRRRRFEAYYCSTVQEALDKALELIPEDAEVSWGGSVTVDEVGLRDALRRRGQPLLDRDAVPAEERAEVMRRAQSCDVFLMGSNAVTEDGQLFNIDGMGNRVAALCYGPKSVIVLAGMNKVVPDLAAAYSRVRHVAAPMNAQRFGLSTPCSVTGQCGDCVSPDCICNAMVATRGCRPAGRVKVILIGEDLGM
ncbi:MAG: lactate utilization protein [Oscillospiraceae bacterium]|nr:lactate utilization protein [Oscillospiraceae bacterium]